MNFNKRTVQLCFESAELWKLFLSGRLCRMFFVLKVELSGHVSRSQFDRCNWRPHRPLKITPMSYDSDTIRKNNHRKMQRMPSDAKHNVGERG
ncbi:hypothetical protein Plhal304r1_c019g0067411 [Plasmopara halstedii]